MALRERSRVLLSPGPARRQGTGRGVSSPPGAPSRELGPVEGPQGRRRVDPARPGVPVNSLVASSSAWVSGGVLLGRGASGGGPFDAGGARRVWPGVGRPSASDVGPDVRGDEGGGGDCPWATGMSDAGARGPRSPRVAQLRRAGGRAGVAVGR